MKKLNLSFSFIFLLILFLTHEELSGQKIKTSYSESVYSEPFSGKVLLYLSRENKQPKDAGFGTPFYCFAINVSNIKPNAEVTFDDSSISFPMNLSKIERGKYYAQVVWDRNTGSRKIGTSPDNIYSETIDLNFTTDINEVFSISCPLKIGPLIFKGSKYLKEVKIPSALLTKFYKRPATIDAAIILPNEYYNDTFRKYPIVYFINGFGGSGYFGWSGLDTRSELLDTIPCITVFLDGNCPTGHSTYANSENNGPWGDALVREFIPTIDKKFRGNGAHLLNGHSSGGWAALWLQINYPMVFTGCWASAPDPIDFRSFFDINLYEDKSMFYRNDNSLRAWGQIGEGVLKNTIRDHYKMETVLYRGEQCVSWNAVWGKKLSDGTPESICNFITGEINKLVAAHWKKYDISLLLRQNWPDLKTKIDGKIKITAGNSDNFSLDKPIKLLQSEMKKLNSNIEFAYYPGDHFTVYTPDYKRDGFRFLAKKYLEWLKQQPTSKKNNSGNK